jgi:hypothetical protein
MPIMAIETLQGAAMKYPIPMRYAAAAVALLGAGGAVAQSAPAAADPVAPPAVISDVGPPPAHERNSLGAIVLENSPVRAQRDRDFDASASRTGAKSKSVGKKVKRATSRARTEAELEQAREDEAVKLYEGGAGAITPK